MNKYVLPILIGLIGIILGQVPPQHLDQRIDAFPGAEGFGRYATGGRGGNVYIVENLNDSGSGSLRAAIEAEGPRYILFAVSGNISLQSTLSISSGDVTLAGQSAPGDGICLMNYPLTIDANNVIIRYMRFRLGDASGQAHDAVSARFQKNIIIDHCSMSWSVDECVSIYANENTTLQWSIISESLAHSVHPKGRHGYGGIWGGRNASFHHNLLAHHTSRTPRLGELGGDRFALTDLVDLRNNVIYNWGFNSCYGGEAMNVNIVNCYYKAGPATEHPDRIVSIDKNLNEGTDVYNIWGKYYVHGNHIEGHPKATQNNWKFGILPHIKSKYAITKEEQNDLRQRSPHPIDDNVSTHTAKIAYEKVLAVVGASLQRDAVDQRIIKNVSQGDFSFTGSKGGMLGIIDTPKDVGGYPTLSGKTPLLDRSRDGMPDHWKKSQGLDPNTFQANGHELHPQYDNLEIYLNSLVDSITLQQK